MPSSKTTPIAGTRSLRPRTSWPGAAVDAVRPRPVPLLKRQATAAFSLPTRPPVDAELHASQAEFWNRTWAIGPRAEETKPLCIHCVSGTSFCVMPLVPNITQIAPNGRFRHSSINNSSGGGGSRTRVHEGILVSLYVRSSLLSSRPGGERATDSGASCRKRRSLRDSATGSRARIIDVS